MPLTVLSLMHTAGLGLRLRAGAGGVEREIGWVHVSELADPTPFLQGGELLLTTGVVLPPDAGTQEEFVRRLADAGVAGLGFGTGLSHEEVPAPLCAAAEAAGMPVVEVPRGTPFIAISKAVARANAADDYAAVTRVHDAHQALTRAAFGHNPVEGLVRQLAREVGWAVLYDPSGAVLNAAPDAADDRAVHLCADVRRLRAQRGPASAGLTLDGDTVVVQSLVCAGRVRGFLAVGHADPLAQADRYVINAAASLITLVLGQTAPLENAYRNLRTVILRLLLAGQAEAAQRLVRDLWGGLPAERVRVVALTGATQARAAATDLLDVWGKEPESLFYAELDKALVVLLTDALEAEVRLTELVERVPDVTLGISEPLGYAEIAEGHHQAVQAAQVAGRDALRLMWYRDVVGGGMLSLLGQDRAASYAAALLEPILRHDAVGRGALVESLRAWLEQHGQWDPAAVKLGVHRHTLRYRMGKVEQLLGRSLDSPTLRAELWLALQTLPPATD